MARERLLEEIKADLEGKKQSGDWEALRLSFESGVKRLLEPLEISEMPRTPSEQARTTPVTKLIVDLIWGLDYKGWKYRPLIATVATYATSPCFGENQQRTIAKALCEHIRGISLNEDMQDLATQIITVVLAHAPPESRFRLLITQVAAGIELGGENRGKLMKFFEAGPMARAQIRQYVQRIIRNQATDKAKL